jgi:hypothetical protein
MIDRDDKGSNLSIWDIQANKSMLLSCPMFQNDMDTLDHMGIHGLAKRKFFHI